MEIEAQKQVYEQVRHELRAGANKRPIMVGLGEGGHHLVIREILRMVWVAGILRHTKHVTVHLSPTQFQVLVESGPLLRPIQKRLTVANKYTLLAGWDDEIRAIPRTNFRNDHWTYAFFGPIGPRFSFLEVHGFFSHQSFFGVRFEDRFWGQLLKDSYPTATPSPLEVEPSLGLVIAAHLDSTWFTGLPFRSEEAQTLQYYSTDTSYLYKDKRTGELKFVQRRHQRMFPETTVVWHERDDLFSSEEQTLDRQLHHWARLRAYA